MSGQMTFAEEQDLSRRRKQTKRERFLAEMDAVVPWARWVALIEPHYPQSIGSSTRIEGSTRIWYKAECTGRGENDARPAR